jgi:hypothetical protein
MTTGLESTWLRLMEAGANSYVVGEGEAVAVKAGRGRLLLHRGESVELVDAAAARDLELRRYMGRVELTEAQTLAIVEGSEAYRLQPRVVRPRAETGLLIA